MGIEDIQQALLKQHGLRVTPAMSEYILSKIQSATDRDLTIIAGDAKTGVPLRTVISIDALRNSAPPQS
jgi:hypothetical protein